MPMDVPLFKLKCHDRDITPFVRRAKRDINMHEQSDELVSHYSIRPEDRKKYSLNFHGVEYVPSIMLKSHFSGTRFWQRKLQGQQAWIMLTPLQLEGRQHEPLDLERPVALPQHVLDVALQVNTALQKQLCTHPQHECHPGTTGMLTIHLFEGDMPRKRMIDPFAAAKDVLARLERIADACKAGNSPLGDIPPIAAAIPPVAKPPHRLTTDYPSSSILRPKPPPLPRLTDQQQAALAQETAAIAKQTYFAAGHEVMPAEYGTFRDAVGALLKEKLPDMDDSKREALQRAIVGSATQTFPEYTIITEDRHHAFGKALETLLASGRRRS